MIKIFYVSSHFQNILGLPAFSKLVTCLGLIDIYSPNLKTSKSQVTELMVHDLRGSVETSVKKEDNSVKKKEDWNCSDEETDQNDKVVIKRKKEKLKENGVVELKYLACVIDVSGLQLSFSYWLID